MPTREDELQVTILEKKNGALRKSSLKGAGGKNTKQKHTEVSSHEKFGEGGLQK